MMEEAVIRFGTDGWRGRIAEDYTFANVRRCAQGFASYCLAKGWAGESVVIGYDKRFDSEYFAAAAAEVLAANGLRVWLTDGPTPTPVIAYAVVARGAKGASHRELTRPSCGAREQQPGDVGAREQEYGGRGAGEREEHGPDVADDLGAQRNHRRHPALLLRRIVRRETRADGSHERDGVYGIDSGAHATQRAAIGVESAAQKNCPLLVV